MTLGLLGLGHPQERGIAEDPQIGGKKNYFTFSKKKCFRERERGWGGTPQGGGRGFFSGAKRRGRGADYFLKLPKNWK